MGFLNRILDKVRMADAYAEDLLRMPDERSARQLETQYRRDRLSFDEKIQEILKEFGDVTLERDIPAEVMEQQAGRLLYARGGNRCLARPFSYRLGRNGKVLYIRLWSSYGVYDHVANRQIRMYCDQTGIPVLDFFEYMPNGYFYVQQRVSGALSALG